MSFPHRLQSLFSWVSRWAIKEKNHVIVDEFGRYTVATVSSDNLELMNLEFKDTSHVRVRLLVCLHSIL